MSTRAPSPVSGPRKAAILITIMGEEAASAIYRHLPDKDVQIVTREIAEMGKVPPQVIQEILEEYARLAMTQDYVGQGGLDFAKRLLVKAFGDTSAKDHLQRAIRLQET